nr:hypothetical protein BaRGS_007982 [Batillaria attramentaria]
MNTRTSLVFSVKACANAHVALSRSLDLESDMAEIVIGAGGVTPATSNAFAGPKCTCVNNKAPTVSQHALAVKETQEAAARLQKEWC